MEKTLLTNRAGKAPRKVTLADIAGKAGVSRVAVGKVLLGSGTKGVGVGEDTARHIRQIADFLGYTPNRAAQQLRGRRSHVVGVVKDSRIAHPINQMMVHMEKLCLEKGYRFLVGQAHENISVLERDIRDFVSRDVEAIFCMSHSYKDAVRLPKLLTQVKNVLFFEKPAMGGLSFVGFDLEDGITQAMDHLVERGHRKIGIFLTNGVSSSTKNRVHAFWKYIQKNRLEAFDGQIHVSNALSTEDMLAEERERCLEHLILELKLDALLAENDLMALQVIQFCRRRDIRVPQDIAVTGCDNESYSEFVEPSLTTIDLNMQETARVAVETLFDLIEGNVSSWDGIGRLVKPRLLVRDST